MNVCLYALPGCPGKVTITKIDADFDSITIYWRKPKNKLGFPLYTEVKYKYAGLEDWIIKLIIPAHHSFKATDLPFSTRIDFELRAVGYEGVFGPITKKSTQTKCMSDVYDWK